ncbi:MAG: hypothetical protein WCA60_03110, partial [Methanoregula sp.]
NRTEKCSLAIHDPHDNTAVEFALGRTVVMDGASQKTTVRPEKTAGTGMLIGKGMIGEYILLVLINTSGKLRPC